jgi:transcriptional regulator with XRE-family HTH domain
MRTGTSKRHQVLRGTAETWSLRYLAQLTGLDPGNLSRIESGRGANPASYEAIAKAFGISVTDLTKGPSLSTMRAFTIEEVLRSEREFTKFFGLQHKKPATRRWAQQSVQKVYEYIRDAK